jgi:vacuolar-type H+-ATPase subunit H
MTMYKSDDETSKLSSANRQEYQRYAENQITDWQQQIDVLKEKGKDLVGDAKSELDAVLEKLEENKNTFSSYLSELGDRAEDQWDDFKDEAEEKWSAISDSVQKLFSKYS